MCALAQLGLSYVDRTYIKERTEENDTEGVEVADNVVGHAVASEHCAEIVGRVSKTACT